MHTMGTIHPDGRVQYYGYEPMKSRLLGITGDYISIHHPGGTYWDNGGEHYVSANIEVYQLTKLQRGNVEGTWLFGLGYRVANFHSTPKEACREALRKLANDGDEIADRVNQKKES